MGRRPVQSPLQTAPNPAKWIKELVHHAFLQRNDCIIGNVDAFRANFAATFRNIAVADPLRPPKLLNSVFSIERMHFKGGDVNEKPRTNEFVMLPVVPQNVTNVLAKKALDAFPEFLHPIDILLFHSPSTVWRVGRPRLEWFDLFLHPKIP